MCGLWCLCCLLFVMFVVCFVLFEFRCVWVCVSTARFICLGLTFFLFWVVCDVRCLGVGLFDLFGVFCLLRCLFAFSVCGVWVLIC